MPTARLLAAAALAVMAAPATAQLSNRSIALETGISASVVGGGDMQPLLALAASTWLDGPVEAVARFGIATAPQTAGRPAARSVSGTVGIRVSLLPDPLRPQVGVEIGWARVERPDRTDDELALGAGVGLEWFPRRDVSVAARAALRRVGTATGAELLVGAAAYF